MMIMTSEKMVNGKEIERMRDIRCSIFSNFHSCSIFVRERAAVGHTNALDSSKMFCYSVCVWFLFVRSFVVVVVECIPFGGSVHTSSSRSTTNSLFPLWLQLRCNRWKIIAKAMANIVRLRFLFSQGLKRFLFDFLRFFPYFRCRYS